MAGRHWALGGVAALIGIALLGWLMLPAESGTAEPGGLVRIADAAPSVRTPGTAAAPVAVERMPVAATEENVTLADEQSYLLAHERRDPGWADSSEAAIHNLLRSIAYVGRGRFLEVKCAGSVCEVTGMADADRATGTLQPVWEALERDTAGDELRAHGLERTAAIFGNGRSPEQFVIQYRRIGKPRES